MPRIAEARTGSDSKKQYLHVKNLYRTDDLEGFLMPILKFKTTEKVSI